MFIFTASCDALDMVRRLTLRSNMARLSHRGRLEGIAHERTVGAVAALRCR